jgi:hypothetical protein
MVLEATLVMVPSLLLFLHDLNSFEDTCISQLSITITKCPRQLAYEGKRVILAHDSGAYS